MPNARVKRVPVPCSLPPDMAQRLLAESDERDFGVSVLIERALVAQFAKWDTSPTSGTSSTISSGQATATTRSTP